MHNWSAAQRNPAIAEQHFGTRSKRKLTPAIKITRQNANAVETGYYYTGYNDNSLLTTHFCWSRQNSYLLYALDFGFSDTRHTTIRF